jgi:hypothetical protein
METAATAKTCARRGVAFEFFDSGLNNQIFRRIKKIRA